MPSLSSRRGYASWSLPGLVYVVAVAVISCVTATTSRGAEDRKPAQAVIGSSHHFTFAAPVAGRTVEQDVTFALGLKETTVQGKSTVQDVESKLTRRQVRSLTVLAASEGRITKARVTYKTAEQEVGQKRAGEALAMKPIPQANAGKTYLISREKPEDELSITDESGKAPPDDERKLVLSSMDAIGRPNPIGKFLHDRVLRVGQTVEVPNDLANELLGLDGAVGKVTKFEMAFTRASNRGGILCGEFETRIDLQSDGPAGQSTRFRGRMIVEVNTCRAIEAEFAGPVSFVENHGTAGAGFQVFSVGTLRVKSILSKPAETAKKESSTRR
jgi:hypothetical protein